MCHWVQISAIKVLLGDLRGGLGKVNTEILKAAGVDANSAFAHRQFGDLMMAFHQHAKTTFADAEVHLLKHHWALVGAEKPSGVTNHACFCHLL